MLLTFLFYMTLSFVLFVILMRLRKIAITSKNRPRVHRSTYLNR